MTKQRNNPDCASSELSGCLAGESTDTTVSSGAMRASCANHGQGENDMGNEILTATDIRNHAMSYQEVATWLINPPLKYFAYVSESRRTLETWMGDKLGDIQVNTTYKTPAFGGPSTRQSIRVRATNGQWYSGTYYKSSGDYARIKWTARKGW